MADTITKNLKQANGSMKKYEFKIYTQQEADELKIEYVDWKKSKNWDYVLSDDGWVSQRYRGKIYKNGKANNEHIVVPFGEYWSNSNRQGMKMLYEERRGTGRYSYTRPKTWIEHEMNTKRLKKFVTAYAMQWLTRKEIDYRELGMIYRKDQKIPEATAKRLIKQKEVIKMVEDELVKLMAGKGIDKEWVINIMKDAVDMAREKKEPDIMLKAAKDFRAMLGMDNTKKLTHTESVEITGDLSAIRDRLPKDGTLTATRIMEQE